ncbi:radical SAM protein [Bacteroidales bacterium]|nr:radical SAM protein [Bacteroidales bacterium]
MLFQDIIFGPIKSRRLGVSLGINLLPINGKLCSFDCIYCECGFNADGKNSSKLPSRAEVKEALEKKLISMQQEGIKPDVLTFAGNGEPTLHPDFAEIIEDTIATRDKYAPFSKISVLSNASTIHKDSVFEALKKVDNNILKLDTALDSKLQLIDQPNSKELNIKELTKNLKKFEGKLIIQTIFLKGRHLGQSVDNTGAQEVEAWIKLILEIKPKQVMIYTIDRETPSKTLEKASLSELEKIAKTLRDKGFEVSVAG